ncbi:hypothetical protein PFISCL1PPCAC_8248 [Pristionchus fissidentatus]|uniref:TFIIS N-terminal domain-containing protein n=1 Tax=Pristionchus fissidentatus TaxID=1538716 RepID=A0AAV5VBA1_9BILA|nr:hypothetical protein PFISCL1PPCAC_8248 [Pristionchus fissidentatus]
MVACAVAASAVHSSSSVVGGGERRAPVASPEVSRAALLPPKAGAMAVTPAASVEQLKQQLQTAIENKDSEKATLAIDGLERVILTREVLESTRIGLAVNNARKEMSELWPPLAKKCRGLIKGWQKLVEPTTNSSSASTSRNGTPGLVSPAIGRRLTPHTPASKRITPGIASERASNLSPANGSYAPKGACSTSSSRVQSPVLHKSQSVGCDLKDENGIVRNGKRKPDEPAIGTTPSTIKRAKTTASGLSSVGGALTSPVPPSTPSLIETRRAAVQSTSDLVAQLTSNLPQHLGFEDAAKAHEEKVKREIEDQQLATALATGGLPPQSPYVFDKKRKYERKKPLTGTPSSAASSSSSTTTVRIVTPPVDEERKGGLVLKLSLSRTTTDCGSIAQTAAAASERERKEEKERRKKEKRESASLHASKSAPSLAMMDKTLSGGGPSTSDGVPSTMTSSGGVGGTTTTSSMRNATTTSATTNGVKKEKVRRVLANIDWFSMVPSIDELQKRVEKGKERRQLLSGMTDSEKAYTVHVGDRVVLALPYIEIEDKPDFLKFNYPDPGRFYAEENFVGGLMERPVDAAAAAAAAATPSTSAAAAT